MTKKKTVKIVVGTLLGVVIAAAVVFLALFLQFWFSTTGDIEAACRENSMKSANNFYITGDGDLEHYLFAVAQDGDDTKGQELLVFYEQPFGLTAHTKRYTLVYQSSQNPQTTVSSYLFTPTWQGEQRMVYFSDNAAQIDKLEYTSVYNLNGKNYTITTDYDLSPYQPFVCVSAPLHLEEEIVNTAGTSAGQTVFTG